MFFMAPPRGAQGFRRAETEEILFLSPAAMLSSRAFFMGSGDDNDSRGFAFMLFLQADRKTFLFFIDQSPVEIDQNDSLGAHVIDYKEITYLLIFFLDTFPRKHMIIT